MIYERLAQKGLSAEFSDVNMALGANVLDSKEVESEKLVADAMLLSGNSSKAVLACWVSDSLAPIAGTIAIAPIKDFSGTRIQYPTGNIQLKWVTLTITPKNGKTVFIIGANSESVISSKFISSFDALQSQNRMQSLISYCLCCMEDLILMPQFWESLTEDQKEAVVRTHTARYFPKKMPLLGNWQMYRLNEKAVGLP